MKRLGLALLLGVLVLAAAVVWLLRGERTGRSAPPARETPPPAAEESGDSPLAEVDAAGREREPVSVDARADSPRELRIYGRLVFVDGSPPPAEAEVVARTGDSEVAALAKAAPDGTFSISIPEDLPPFRFGVVADFAALDSEDIFHVRSPRLREEVVLRLHSAGVVEGTILGLDGKSPAGGRAVLVRTARGNDEEAVPLQAKADAEGKVRFPGLLEGKVLIFALAPGCSFAQAEVAVVSRTTARVVITLPRESAVSGRVVDETGAVIPGAKVVAEISKWGEAARARPRLDYGKGESGPDGSFRIGSLESGAHGLSASHPAHLDPEKIPLEIAPGQEIGGIEIVLRRGHSLSGRVVDCQGSGGSGARLYAFWDSRSGTKRIGPPLVREGRSGADGAFRIEGLAGGPSRLFASHSELGVGEVANLVEDAEGVVLVLEGPSGVRGTVVDAASGEPLRRFSVLALRRRVPEEAPLGFVPEERGFERGEFSLLDLPAGTYDLAFRAPNLPETSLSGIEVRPATVVEPLAVRMGRGASILGKVIDATAGSPVEKVALALLTPSGGSPVTPFSGWLAPPRPIRSRADGSFELWGISPGEWRIEAKHESFLPFRTEPIALREGERIEDFLVSLSQGGAVDGFAIREDGGPWAGARIGANLVERLVGSHKSATANEAGYFLLEGLEPGRWGVAAGTLRGLVEVVAGEVTRVELRVEEKQGSCTVRGRITLDGKPSVLASVTISSHKARTAEDGTFSLEKIPPGPAQFTVHTAMRDPRSLIDRRLVWMPVVIPEEDEYVLDFAFPPSGIEGRVMRDSDGAPVPDAAINAQFEVNEGETFSLGGAITDDEGRYSITGLLPGVFQVSASAAGLRRTVQSGILVTEGAMTETDLRLEGGALLTAKVHLPTGDPARRANLTLISAVDGTRGASPQTG
jgi:hypothetical protein